MKTGWRFEGKVVLVTGSSQGIGAATIREFARHGADGVVNYFADPRGVNAANATNLAGEINGLAGREAVIPLPADITRMDQVQAMMDGIRQRWGRLDVLVNNAGILRDRTLAKMTPEEWDAVIDTNLSGAFRCLKAAQPILAADGRVVSIASIAGQVGFFGQANYAAAKAGIEGLTRVLAKEFAKKRITVNAVAPGLVQTAMADSIPPEARAKLESMIPLGCLADPEDIVNAILFLASEESRHITGQTLNVNGGWHA